MFLDDKQSGRLILLTEERSRFADNGGMLEPSAIPDDGLCRVIVDWEHSADLMETLKVHPIRAKEDRIASKQSKPGLNYPKMIGLAATALCGETGWLWCVGELHREEAELVQTLSGIDMATIRTSIVHALVIYRINAVDVHDTTVWPHYTSDYGFRIFAFYTERTELEQRLIQLEAAVRQDGPEATEIWKRLDEERALQIAEAKRKDPHVRLAFNADARQDTPASVAIWKELQKECSKRSNLPALCRDALFCVLTDGPHHLEVAYHSTQLNVTDITACLQATARQYEVGCSVIPNLTDEFRLLL